MLSNLDIEGLAEKIELPLVVVVSKDELKNVPHQIGSYYINMQDSNKGEGSHWVFFRLYCDEEREESKKIKDYICGAIYFDPFGIDMPKEVESYLKKFKPIPYNNKQIQSVNSSQCGWYCLYCDYCLEHRRIGETYLADFERFINSWSDDPLNNLTLLKARFKKLVLPENIA